ncbi:hypothetical protein H4R34_002114 [Dimargaris verticillata]|uniref:Uncharacterized protein n=1 Tax=Dimargaris verticillata TaxID=2761393 RepID=A0A9W8EED4_9FUNG|nr:hypothetical protein H4R34_002114 [Dimargaris verticillata]
MLHDPNLRRWVVGAGSVVSRPRLYRDLLIHLGTANECSADYDTPEELCYQELHTQLDALCQSDAAAGLAAKNHNTPLPQFKAFKAPKNIAPLSLPMTTRTRSGQMTRSRRQVLEEDTSDETYETRHRRYELAEKRSRNRDLELAAHDEYRREILQDRLQFLAINHLPSSTAALANKTTENASNGTGTNGLENEPNRGLHSHNGIGPAYALARARPTRRPQRPSVLPSLPHHVSLRRTDFELPATWLRRKARRKHE